MIQIQDVFLSDLTWKKHLFRYYLIKFQDIDILPMLSEILHHSKYLHTTKAVVYYIAIAVYLAVKYLVSTYYVLGAVYFYCHVYFHNCPFQFTPLPNWLYRIF